MADKKTALEKVEDLNAQMELLLEQVGVEAKVKADGLVKELDTLARINNTTRQAVRAAVQSLTYCFAMSSPSPAKAGSGKATAPIVATNEQVEKIISAVKGKGDGVKEADLPKATGLELGIARAASLKGRAENKLKVTGTRFLTVYPV